MHVFDRLLTGLFSYCLASCVPSTSSVSCFALFSCFILYVLTYSLSFPHLFARYETIPLLLRLSSWNFEIACSHPCWLLRPKYHSWWEFVPLSPISWCHTVIFLLLYNFHCLGTFSNNNALLLSCSFCLPQWVTVISLEAVHYVCLSCLCHPEVPACL